MPRYKKVDREQYIMLPTNINSLVDEDHIARKLWFILSEMDLSLFSEDLSNDKSGALAYKPINLLCILLYAYMKGIHSSREIEHRCKEDLAFMFLCELQKPDHTTISNFRTKHQKALEELFSKTVFLGIESKLIDFKHIANDGTKINGAGSKDQIVWGKNIEKRIKSCEKYAKKLIEKSIQADKTDIESNKKLEKKLRKTELKLEKLNKAKNAYENAKSNPKYNNKEDKFKYNLTEPDSRLLKDKDGYHSGYNCQASVDNKTQMIIDNRVTQSQSDNSEGEISRNRLLSLYGKDKLDGSVLSFDNGYNSHDFVQLDGKDNINLLISQGKELSKTKSDDFKYLPDKDIFVCPQGNELTYVSDVTFRGIVYKKYMMKGCSNCNLNVNCFRKGTKKKINKTKLIRKDHESFKSFVEKYKSKLNEESNIEEYKKRMSTVEPVFGYMNHHRNFTRFSVWGKFKAGIEFTLICIVHNFLKLINYASIEELMLNAY
jgi:transposase